MNLVYPRFDYALLPLSTGRLNRLSRTILKSAPLRLISMRLKEPVRDDTCELNLNFMPQQNDNVLQPGGVDEDARLMLTLRITTCLMLPHWLAESSAWRVEEALLLTALRTEREVKEKFSHGTSRCLNNRSPFFNSERGCSQNRRAWLYSTI